MATKRKEVYLSELIARLQRQMEKHGDHPVALDSGLEFNVDNFETAFNHSPALLHELDEETKNSLLSQPPRYSI